MVLTYCKYTRVFIIAMGLIGILGFILWLAIFFGCFDSNLKKEYVPAYNCKVLKIYENIKFP